MHIRRFRQLKIVLNKNLTCIWQLSRLNVSPLLLQEDTVEKYVVSYPYMYMYIILELWVYKGQIQQSYKWCIQYVQ